MRARIKKSLFSAKTACSAVLTLLLCINASAQGTWDKEFAKAKEMITSEWLEGKYPFFQTRYATEEQPERQAA